MDKTQQKQQYITPVTTLVLCHVAENLLAGSNHKDDLGESDEGFTAEGKSNTVGFSVDRYGYKHYVGLGLNYDIWGNEK